MTLEGNFKRSLNQRSEKSSFYVEMLDYDKDNLIVMISLILRYHSCLCRNKMEV